MTQTQGDRRHVDRRIAEHLLEFGARIGPFHSGFHSESGGVHALHGLRDGEVVVREVSGEEPEQLRQFAGRFRFSAK